MLIKRRRNKIIGIKKNDLIWITKPEEIEKEFINKLTDIYSSQDSNKQNDHNFYSNLDSPTIQDRYHLPLTSIPYEKEIKDALFDLHPFKSPGDDGLHAIFYQANWDIVKTKVIPSIQNCFRTNSIPDSWGDTLLCLIPKVDNPSIVSHYRPISLCNTLYKISTKILAKRIKPLLPSLISPFQGAYTPRRHTLDLFLIAQETLNSMNYFKVKEGWLVVKIDIRMAFDTISWSFINKMLRIFKITASLNDLIISCLQKVKYTPLINGKKVKSIYPTRGIKQGDPISPYLFILAMEFLRNLIREKISNKTWNPFRFKNKEPSISHLFFVDDVLFFDKAKLEHNSLHE